MALPTVYLSSADWSKDDGGEERIICNWGGWIVTFLGHGLQRVSGALIRGEICSISELELQRAEVTPGTAVTTILAVEKPPIPNVSG